MTIKLKPLDQQVIVVTGASSGIGLLTAKSAAQAGAKVMLVSRNADALTSARNDIVAAGGTAEIAVADVGDAAAVDAAAAAAVAAFGRIDTWVNNAGVAIYAKLLDTPDAEHEQLFRTNYFGMVHACRAAMPHLRKNGGALITVGSIAGDMPSPILGAYTASKHAVKAYIESLRIELLADRVPVSVTLVKPSGVATPIGEHAANHLGEETLVPPPAYDPQLVADAVLHCAVHSRRAVTVGGVGRAQVLFANHFPALFDRLAPLITPLLSNDRPDQSGASNLWAPGRDGIARSRREPGLPVSPFTTPSLRPALTGLAVVSTLALLLGVGRVSRAGKA